MDKYTDIALEDLEAIRHQDRDEEMERSLSINTWIERIRGQAGEAHGYARSGETFLERGAWLKMAEICIARVEAIDWATDHVESVEFQEGG